jgi:RNA polymerase sigma factor (sigma-70 family)
MATSRTIDPEVQELVARAREGDAEAFAGLYDRYVDTVYAYVARRVGKRELAEDLTADCFLRALQTIERLTWRGVDIGAWLMPVARNRVTDHFKSARARFEHATDAVEDRPSVAGDDSPEDVVMRWETAYDLAKPDEMEELICSEPGWLLESYLDLAAERDPYEFSSTYYAASRDVYGERQVALTYSYGGVPSHDEISSGYVVVEEGGEWKVCDTAYF